jgi:hypothetical protein
MKLRIFWAMMEAAHTSETSVDIQLRTRQYIPEDSEYPFDACRARDGAHIELHVENRNIF